MCPLSLAAGLFPRMALTKNIKKKSHWHFIAREIFHSNYAISGHRYPFRLLLCSHTLAKPWKISIIIAHEDISVNKIVCLNHKIHSFNIIGIADDGSCVRILWNVKWKYENIQNTVAWAAKSWQCGVSAVICNDEWILYILLYSSHIISTEWNKWNEWIEWMAFGPSNICIES